VPGCVAATARLFHENVFSLAVQGESSCGVGSSGCVLLVRVIAAAAMVVAVAAAAYV
jgi:hypothetical protein